MDEWQARMIPMCYAVPPKSLLCLCLLSLQWRGAAVQPAASGEEDQLSLVEAEARLDLRLSGLIQLLGF